MRNWIRKTLVLALSPFLILPLAAQMTPPRPLVVRNASLVDGTGKPPQPNQSIVIERGRITKVGGTVQTPADAEVIDAQGRVVVPALMDALVSLNRTPAGNLLRAEAGLEQQLASLRAMLTAGVMTARLVQGPVADQRYLARWSQDNLLAAPRMFGSGPTFTAPNGHPTEQYNLRAPRERDTREVKDADEARTKAREVAHTGADAFEISYDSGGPKGSFPRLTKESLEILVREAHGHDLKVFCSVSKNAEALEAVAAGCDTLEAMAEESLSDELLAAMNGKDVAFLPALNSQGDFLGRLDRDALKRYLKQDIVEQSLSPVLKKSLEDAGGTLAYLRKLMAIKPELRKTLEQQRQRAFENVRRARQAGLRIVAGTGAGDTLIFPGAAVHRELELLAEAGLTPVEAICAATRNVALSLAQDEDLGTIEPGKWGDLVILDAKSLGQISATQRIRQVIRAGRVVNRDHPELY